MQNKAFTLAEVLITLAVIGVVAAMTLPNLVKNYQKKITVTKLQKAYSVLSQMVLKSFADNGAASDYLTSGETLSSSEMQKFFQTYWLPYFNSPVVAANGKTFYDTTTPHTNLLGSTNGTFIITNYSTGRILFQTSDGIIYFIILVKWVYEYDDEGNIIKSTATYSTETSVYVDINGTKGPNRYGKDVFIFKIDFDDNQVYPYGEYSTYSSITSNCSTKSTGTYCAAKIKRDGWQIKEDYPW